MITQSLRDIIANMTEPELKEILECVEERAESLPAPKIFEPFFERSDLMLKINSKTREIYSKLHELSELTDEC